jgi:hypothetical protein
MQRLFPEKVLRCVRAGFHLKRCCVCSVSQFALIGVMDQEHLLLIACQKHVAVAPDANPILALRNDLVVDNQIVASAMIDGEEIQIRWKVVDIFAVTNDDDDDDNKRHERVIGAYSNTPYSKEAVSVVTRRFLTATAEARAWSATPVGFSVRIATFSKTPSVVGSIGSGDGAAAAAAPAANPLPAEIVKARQHFLQMMALMT